MKTRSKPVVSLSFKFHSWSVYVQTQKHLWCARKKSYFASQYLFWFFLLFFFSNLIFRLVVSNVLLFGIPSSWCKYMKSDPRYFEMWCGIIDVIAMKDKNLMYPLFATTQTFYFGDLAVCDWHSCFSLQWWQNSQTRNSHHTYERYYERVTLVHTHTHTHTHKHTWQREQWAVVVWLSSLLVIPRR